MDGLVVHQLFQKRRRGIPVDADQVEEGHVEPGAQEGTQVFAQGTGGRVGLAQRQQFGTQVDDELHPLRDADELAQQADRRRFQHTHQRPSRFLSRAPVLDLGDCRLARQPIVVGQRQEELFAACRRERKIGLPQFGSTAASRSLAALGLEAGVDAALEPWNVVVGQIGAQRRPDGFAGATGGIDEGDAQAFERAVDGVGERKCHSPIMSWQTCHSSGVTRARLQR